MNYEISTILQITSENMKKYSHLETRRLFHGRGGTYENILFINIDLFPPALLITLYEDRDNEWKEILTTELLKMNKIDCIVFQNRVKAPWKNEIVKGVLPERHIVEENSLKYTVSLEPGENPGIFLDMRDGRSYVNKISKNRRVLNLFSYTCAFSIAAVEGGASSVLNMDMNSNSLNKGRINHQLNFHRSDNVAYLSHNILKSFGKIIKKGPYDLILIDPPPSQGHSFNLIRDYGKIMRKTCEMLSYKGEILACLNSHNVDFVWFKDFLSENLGQYEIIAEFGAGDDFPEKNRELGLKTIHLRLS
ncbi:MAG: class I SAM-dependent methyltransferase [Spirochaetaceae bacterium]|jgi:23S rRNA (cytosine1962-C5)-methyltransferase|nr:class I SAM-dependent methyltransferase [Spirochaetaceae bacterium]